MESGWKPNADVSPACPRCGSADTKFCYYNNYSLTQPRYFCKGCRRYWTRGGSLRNVPIGGGCRKSRRGKPPPRVSTSARNSEPNGPSPARPEASISNNSIDLAAVYANFLNQSPPQIETVPPVEFSNFPASSHLPPEFEFPARLPEAQLFGSGGGYSVFPDPFQLSSVNPMENDLLPPLPGEESWPNSDAISYSGRAEVRADEENLVNGNMMSPFCGLNIEAFFRS